MNELQEILEWMLGKVESGAYAENEIQLAVKDLMDEIKKLDTGE